MKPTMILWAAFACFVIAFIFIVFVFYRQKREAHFKQTEAEMGRMIAEVEMKALRAQMNPHFIFNALNSVYRFMEKNDLKNAGDYLLKVSGLMRSVLENSIHKSVPLQDDLNALQLYMEIEQMWMQHSFSINVQIANDVDTENTYVPPLIIQPFVENAIWHGLRTKDKEGTLGINIYKSDGLLYYIIEDNGTENKTAEPVLQGKKKSLGMNITKERLEVLNRSKNSNADFTVIEKFNADNIYEGRKVTLWLPLEIL